MIRRSIALDKRLERETLRAAGSLARLVCYSGTMPELCEQRADGDRLASMVASEEMIRCAVRGEAPKLIEGATYWRILDNGGEVLMQGDGNG